MFAIRIASFVFASFALFAAPASASEVLKTEVEVPVAETRDCHDRLLSGGEGFAQRRVTAPATGVIGARLEGEPGGDWDLGIFDAAGRAVAGSAQFGNSEVAEGIALRGQRLTVQACRRVGPVDSVELTVAGRSLPRGNGAPGVRLVRVATPSAADKQRLVATGLDLTEHAAPGHVDVVLHGGDDARALSEAGFGFEVLIPDLAAHDRAALRTSHDDSSPGAGVPSGRTSYRRIADYSADLKRLAEDHPDLVKPITLPYASREGRSIEGIEITRDPHARDGKPVFLQMGLHHSREWPSGEHAIEWAIELVENYGADPRTTELVDSTRTIVIPVINPDGFNLSREIPLGNENLDPIASQGPLDSAQPVVDPGFAYKRKNCHMVQLNPAQNGYEPAAGACSDADNRGLGVDPNRNYGGLWGGPGASPDPLSETFWGEGPFSEPETRNVQWLVSRRHVTTLISNHTYSDLILRPPGVAAYGDTVDEDLYRSLGADMAGQNGYANWQSYQLYDTTGTTEDWSYFATGGLGFTFEIGRAAQSLTNDVNTDEPNSDLAVDIAGSYAGVGFHPPYALGVIAEWNGKGPHAGKGNREAYYTALESTADAERHSVITGEVEPGTELTLTKTFQTATSPRGADANGLPQFDPAGTPVEFTDHLETEMMASGDEFVWHVNPSTRPDVLRGRPGRMATGPTSPPQSFQHDPATPLLPAAGAPVPGSYEERDFSIEPSADNGRLDLHLEWPPGETELGPDDLDLHLYRKDELGLYQEIASSTNAGGPEDITVVDPIAGDYRFRVENWYATNESAWDWRASLSFAAPTAPVPGTREAWTLTCTTPDGETDSTSVVVDRGEAAEALLPGCSDSKKPKKPKKPKSKT